MQTGIGDTLRAARRAQSLSLTDAAAATRVRETYLAALEEEDFGALGGDVYAKGFLRSYARYLSLDPEPLVAAFQRGAHASEPRGRGRPRPPARVAGAASTPGSERPAGAAVLLLLLVVVLVVIAYIGLWDGQVAGALVADHPPVAR